MDRMWCLYECYVAISNGVPMTVQFANDDARAFRSALYSGGMSLVQKALAAIDARKYERARPTHLII